MADYSSDDFEGFGAFQNFGGQSRWPPRAWPQGRGGAWGPWRGGPWSAWARGGAQAAGQQAYRPRPFPAVPAPAFKRQAPWPPRPPPPPKQRVESNEKSFVMPDDAPENFKELVAQRHCTLCSASINSVVNAEMHYNGRMHQKRLREQKLPQGEYFSGIMRVQPLPELADATPEAKEPPPGHAPKPAALPDLPDGLDARCCRLCGVTFTNAMQSHQHYSGKKHRTNALNSRKVEMAKAAPARLFRCELCNASMNSQDALNSHNAGQKHRNNQRLRDMRQRAAGATAAASVSASASASTFASASTSASASAPAGSGGAGDTSAAAAPAAAKSEVAINSFLSNMRSASTAAMPAADA